MGFLGDLALGAAPSAVNGVLSVFGNKMASDTARKNLDYQMEKYYSPQAQVKNLGAAGINPAVAFGNQSPTFSGGGQLQMPSNPLAGVGTTSIADLSQYLLAKAQAKKAGVETKNIDVETQAKQFELELSKWFSAPAKVAEITLAWKNVMLQDDEHNIKEWQKVKEKNLASLSGIQKQAAEKELGNMDTVIKQQNKQREEEIKLTQEKQKTEKSQQSVNTASARASNAAADYTQSQKKYQDIVNDIKESGKTFELENLIRGYQAENKVNDAVAEQSYTMLARYKQLNDNDKNAAARYLNYMFWFIKEQMPNLPVVPYIKGN